MPEGATERQERRKRHFFGPKNCGVGPELYPENSEQLRYPIPRSGLLPGTKRQKPRTLAILRNIPVIATDIVVVLRNIAMGERRRETSAHPRIPNAKRTRTDSTRQLRQRRHNKCPRLQPARSQTRPHPTTTRRGHRSLNASSCVCRRNRRRRFSIPPFLIDAARRAARPPRRVRFERPPQKYTSASTSSRDAHPGEPCAAR